MAGFQKIQTAITFSLLSLLLMGSTASCTKNRDVASTDPQALAVLNQSSFYPAEQATAASAPSTDDGYIPPPSTGDPSGGNGTVPPPTTGDNGSPSNPPTTSDPGPTGPPVATNPPVQPPVTNPPATNPPSGGPVAGNPPSTDDGNIPPPGGGTSGGGGTPGGDDGTIPPPCSATDCPSIQIKLTRACSATRSAISYPKFIFFEEATAPIFTLELAAEVPQDSPVLAMPGVKVINTAGELSQVSILMAAADLKGVDLIAAPKQFDIKIPLAELKAKLPQWQNLLMRFWVCNDSDGDGRCSDEWGASLLMSRMITSGLENVPPIAVISVWSGRNKTLDHDQTACETQISPLVLDMSGHGFHLVGPEAGVRFDIGATGEAVLTGWTNRAVQNAFLTRDLNGDGKIESGAELFGSATTLRNGTRASNGFEALKELDSNNDGVFDSRDREYASLRLWFDLNRDAQVQSGELVDLKSAGVISISLSYIQLNEVDPHGNATRQRSIFVRQIGDQQVPRQIIDIWFNTIQNGY